MAKVKVYNPNSGEYEYSGGPDYAQNLGPQQGFNQQEPSGGGLKAPSGSAGSTEPVPQQTTPGLATISGGPTPQGDMWSSWQDPYRDIYNQMSNSKTPGTSPIKVEKVEMTPFSQQYQDYRNQMYQQIAGLMDQSGGMKPREYDMIAARNADAIAAQTAGQMELARRNAARTGTLDSGMYSRQAGDIAGQGAMAARQASTNLALEDMARRNAWKQFATEANMNFLNTMGGQEQFQSGLQTQLNQDYQTRREAAQRAAQSAAAAAQNRNWAMQKEIADMGIRQQQYDDAYAHQTYQDELDKLRLLLGIDQASYQSNPLGGEGLTDVWGNPINSGSSGGTIPYEPDGNW